MEETLFEKTFKGIDLGSDFARSKASLENFKKKIDEFKSLKNDGELYIHEHFLKLRNEVDIDREKSKQLIDEHYLALIDELDEFEAACKGKLGATKRVDEIEEFEVDFERLKTDLGKLQVDFNNWKNVETTSLQQSQKLESLIMDVQSELTLDIQFASNIDRLEMGINLAKVYTKLDQKSFTNLGSFHFTINGIKKWSEEAGARLFSPNHRFNGTDWYAGIDNEDNLEMGFYVHRASKKGQKDITVSITCYIFNKNSSKNFSTVISECKFVNDSGGWGREIINLKEVLEGGFYDQENDLINMRVDIKYEST